MGRSRTERSGFVRNQSQPNWNGRRRQRNRPANERHAPRGSALHARRSGLRKADHPTREDSPWVWLGWALGMVGRFVFVMTKAAR